MSCFHKVLLSSPDIKFRKSSTPEMIFSLHSITYCDDYMMAARSQLWHANI